MLNQKITLLCILAMLASASVLFGQGVGINGVGAPPDASAGLDVNFNDRGFLPPRMTTAERMAIPAPAVGLQLYNTDKNCIEFYTGIGWKDLCGQDACTTGPTAPPAEGTHAGAVNSIVWNWDEESSASGYKYNTANDYNTATDAGIATSYTQTGLSCGNSYTLYVWAYNPCGNTAVATLTGTTAACPITITPFVYTGSDQSWTVPAGITSIFVKAWGAGGGGGNGVNTAGGGGGYIEADVSVTPGDVLTIVVGGGGGHASCGGGGGGGRSAVIDGGSSELITAGAGGGGGNNDGGNNISGGAGGGTDGVAGQGPYPGGGGSQVSGGAGGTGPYAGFSGGQFTGGATYDNGCGAGGYGGGGTGGYYGGAGAGGSGWYGGGGAGAVASNSGGGGGSSHSFGTNIVTEAGSGQNAANMIDVDYVSGIGMGGSSGSAGGNGRVLIYW